MQMCRRSYTVRDKETDVELDIDNEYIMSPKDLKTIHFMNKMMDAGVRVFKIEGRARGPEIKYFSNIGVSEFLVEASEVSVGDKLLITGPTTGALFMTLDEARVDLKSVQTVKKGPAFLR